MEISISERSVIIIVTVLCSVYETGVRLIILWRDKKYMGYNARRDWLESKKKKKPSMKARFYYNETSYGNVHFRKSTKENIAIYLNELT